MDALGWGKPDILFVSGDAYVDHPSFAAAVLGRRLAAEGFKVAILPQPDWHDTEAWLALGPPRLFCAVSAGNMDSMINHYTASRKRRNEDAYSPGGRIGLRPDRATGVYAQRCREAFPGIPVLAGGVEASLRRVAHYDYWSDKVRPSVLVSSKADLVGYGMGEQFLVEAARRIAGGENIRDLRNMRGAAYFLGRNEEVPEHTFTEYKGDGTTVQIPSYEEVVRDAELFAHMTRKVHLETNPRNARRITQQHGDRTVVINPPNLPLSTEELDQAHDQPFTREPHPSYTEPIPAHTMIKDSVSIMRGCFGGCTFCSITLHQGREIQSRSEESILREVTALGQDPRFKGTLSDLGGPTANMYRMQCSQPEVEAVCRRLSCVHPTICKLLDTDHGPTKALMAKARETPGIKHVHVASGVRMDLASADSEYLEDLARHHVGGHLKVAPEHVSKDVLGLMKKPEKQSFDEFAEGFAAASKRAGKEQYLVPYFISGHPGSGVEEMIELAVFLKRRGYKPRQVQDFIPAPMDIATCMYHTGIDPLTMQTVKVAKHLRDRRLQRALMQFFLPENHDTVRRVLREYGRGDLIGSGPDCLVPDKRGDTSSVRAGHKTGPHRGTPSGRRQQTRPGSTRRQAPRSQGSSRPNRGQGMGKKPRRS